MDDATIIKRKESNVDLTRLYDNLGYRHFLMRGLEKVKAEFRLMCIGYNLIKMNQLLAEVG